MKDAKSYFTDLFVQRPVLAIVVNLVIVIAGIQAVMTAISGKGDFTVRQYPKSENSAITITTSYVGANAELIRGYITSPIERSIASADGIDYIESTSSQNLSRITARLKLNHNPVDALSEISAKVDQIRADLPPQSQAPVLNIESADSRFAAIYLSFKSDLLKPNEVTDYLVRVVQPSFTAIPGVQKADILGARTFAMRIWLDPKKLAAYNLSPSDIRDALIQNNALASVGKTRGNYIQINLNANTDLKSVQQFKNLVVLENNNSIVKLGEIANVLLGAENYDIDVRFAGENAVFMGIWVLPTANSLNVIEKVRDQTELLKENFPTGFYGNIAYDSTHYIDNAIDEVVKTLIETILIVIVVIFLFLGSLRSVLVPVIVIPVSLIGSIFLMQIFGFSINLLTLLAIVLAVGLVVDDAIVVVENVERHLEEGMKPFDAAFIGARELIGPIIATTITLAAVYAPIAFQEGLTGTLFREFTITLAGAVIISSIVALTLSPMMSSKILKTSDSKSGFSNKVNGFFDRLKDKYQNKIEGTLKNRPIYYFIWILLTLSLLPLYIFSSMTKELAPTEDQGVIFGIVNTASNSTIENSAHFATHTQSAFSSLPEYDYSFQITQPTEGFGGVLLKPWKERNRSVFTIRQELVPKINSNPGQRIISVLPPSLPGASNFPVEFIIASTADSKEVYEIAKEIAKNATKSGLFAFPPSLNMKYDKPQTEISFDFEKISDLGMNLHQITRDLGSLIGGNYVNRFSLDSNSYKVIPQIAREARLTTNQLEDFYFRGGENELIPLSSIATLKNTTEPRSLNRFNQLNAVKISGIPAAPLDSALKVLEQEAEKRMPTGYVVDYGSESRQLRIEGSKFLPSLMLALILVYLVLSAQFNSFRDPLIIILGSVPLGMFGALLFVALRAPGDPWTPNGSWGWTTSWNIYSQVGMITLMGLVTKNSILIVQFANVLQRAGKEKFHAVSEASATRLRPILMTTAATVCGHMMLVFVSGPGAEARNSIGLVLVTGMAIGTLFTLFIVPSLYMLIAKEHEKL